jgi:hypothetical protein
MVLCVCRSRDGLVYVHGYVRDQAECDMMRERLRKYDDTVECEASW